MKNIWRVIFSCKHFDKFEQSKLIQKIVTEKEPMTVIKPTYTKFHYVVNIRECVCGKHFIDEGWEEAKVLQ